MSTVTKLQKSNLKKRDPEVTEIEKNLVEITEVPSSSSFRRSYRLKEKAQGIVIRVDEPVQTKATLETQVNRSRWRSSKLLSRTLTTLEVIRAMKGKQAATPTEATMKSSSSTNMAESREEEKEGDLHLLTATARERRNPKAANEWKLLKNKLGSMRRKGSLSSASEADGEARTQKSVVPSETKSSAPIRSSILSNPSNSVRRSSKSSQDEGIVCKKEDLLFLLSEAHKGGSEKEKSVDQSEASTSDIKEKGATSTATTITITTTTDSSSAEPEKVVLLTDKESGPKENGKRRKSKSEPVERAPDPLPKSCEKSKLKKSEGKTGKVNVVTFCEKLRTSPKLERKSCVADKCMAPATSGADPQQGSSSSAGKTELRAVKWDDSATVDAAVLGDVIEAFLKGMGSSSSSSSVPEKKVSFKKT